jgi:hypothetical protein
MTQAAGQTKRAKPVSPAAEGGLLPIGLIRRVLERHIGSKALVAERVKSGWGVARGLSKKERPVSRQAVYIWLAGRSTSNAIHIAADAVARELLGKEKAEKDARGVKAGAA